MITIIKIINKINKYQISKKEYKIIWSKGKKRLLCKNYLMLNKMIRIFKN